MSNQAQMDIVRGNSSGGILGSGAVAQKLLQSGFSVNALRTQEVLQKDEWVAFDSRVVEVARDRLVLVGDLVSRGLTYDLPNALGKTRIEWERISDMGEANINMAGITDEPRDRVLFDLESMPVPIIHKDFNLNIRVLEASRAGNSKLDTTQAALAARIVAERIEKLAFNGINVGGQNGQVWGLTNHPDVNTGSLTAALSGATGENFVTDFLRMQAAAQGDHMYGPYMYYVPYSAYTRMGNDFKTGSDKTILQRLKEIPGVIDIRPTTNLTTQIVQLQMTPDVMDIVNGFQPTLVQWESNGGMTINFKVMAIMLPRIKSDYEGNCGITIYS